MLSTYDRALLKYTNNISAIGNPVKKNGLFMQTRKFHADLFYGDLIDNLINYHSIYLCFFKHSFISDMEAYHKLFVFWHIWL